jgi:hypothetical protein
MTPELRFLVGRESLPGEGQGCNERYASGRVYLETWGTY